MEEKKSESCVFAGVEVGHKSVSPEEEREIRKTAAG